MTAELLLGLMALFVSGFVAGYTLRAMREPTVREVALGRLRRN